MEDGYFRIKCVIHNTTLEKVICTNIVCEKFDNLEINDQIDSGHILTIFTATNNRIFCSFRGAETLTEYKLAMTCPKSSGNNACGYGNAGLHPYNSHKLLLLRFDLGQKDQADWDNDFSYKGAEVPFGDCS